MSYVSLNSCINHFCQTPHKGQFALIRDDKEGWKVAPVSAPSCFALEDEKCRFEIAKKALQYGRKSFQDIEGFINGYGLKDKKLIYLLLWEFALGAASSPLGKISVKYGLNEDQRYWIAESVAKRGYSADDPIKDYELGEKVSAQIARFSPPLDFNIRDFFGVIDEYLRYETARKVLDKVKITNDNEMELFIKQWDIQNPEWVNNLKQYALSGPPAVVLMQRRMAHTALFY